jgi:hypothetical protein
MRRLQCANACEVGRTDDRGDPLWGNPVPLCDVAAVLATLDRRNNLGVAVFLRRRMFAHGSLTARS